ncbi:MAG TPA: glutamine amidotransferase, partial [Phycisphaerae bacterium]|nr:glutamine amidotransferase [Phycisphaerae bacterium]
VAMLLVRPVVRWQGSLETPGEVAVLLDASRSMAIRDLLLPDGEPVSRAGEVRFAFLAAAQPYTALAARFIINPYAFGATTRPIDHFAPEPLDLRTDIADALTTVAAKKESPPPGVAGAKPGELTATHLAAVILVSDGQVNRARVALEDAARRLAVPVHTVMVGSAEPTDRVRDVAVRDLRAPARVFVRNRPEVRATLTTIGLEGQSFEAVLTLSGKEVDRRRIAPDANQTAQELVFTPPMNTPGWSRLALTVEPIDGELMTANNQAETMVRVDEGGVRVLYLDGRLYPEGKYVARTLGEATEIDLDRRILVGSGAAGAAPAPDDLDGCDVVVLGDLPASVLPAATVARLAQRIREGNLSLLVLGGLSAYGAGGWAATPLAEVLPMTIRAGDGQVPGPISFRPTAEAARHFIFSGGEAAGGAMAFETLPSLAGASAVGPLQPTARLLAESPDGKPLLAVREFARGRVAALTVDTTWQWVLAPASSGAPDFHRRFWRQLILWLAGRDDRPHDDFWVMTDRPRYMIVDLPTGQAGSGPGAAALEAEVTVHVRRDKSEEPPSVRLKVPDGSDLPTGQAGRPVPLTRAAGGDWQAAIPLQEPGSYTLVAEADVGGEPKAARTAFIVEQQDFEMANLLANPETLERVAKASGGTSRSIDGLAALLSELAERLPETFEPVQRRLPLVGRMFLATVLALLAAEWFLRRRWGMA